MTTVSKSLSLLSLQLNEFKRGLHELNYEDLKLLPNSDVFVAYAWHWKQSDDSSGEESMDSESVHSSISRTPPPLSEDELDFNTGFTTHTITFKCMGTTRDTNHQEVLSAAAAALKEGKDVPTRLQPEPDNPVDANAIMFECQVDKGWKRIGYVVQDILTFQKRVHGHIHAHALLALSRCPVNEEIKTVSY